MEKEKLNTEEKIIFPESLRRLLLEVTRRHQEEIKSLLKLAEKELGIEERIRTLGESSEEVMLLPNFEGFLFKKKILVEKTDDKK